nr:serine hydrolase [Paraurantiacibacter namhicola]
MTGILRRFAAGAALFLSASLGAIAPASANESNPDFERSFDRAFGTEMRAPRDYSPQYDTPVERNIAALADGSNGRIGVYALDLSTGMEVSVLGDQRFPMASTSKIAIAATYLAGVDQGRWTLQTEWPLLWPLRSKAFSSARAPVKAGKYMSAYELIDLMITRSSNPATDALLAAVGGPQAVNDWARSVGMTEFTLTRDIATLVRDDGEFDPAMHVDVRDSASPRTMGYLLAGIYNGHWLSASSRNVILSAMERCITGKRRIPAQMPDYVTVGHKTGSLNNTSSDIGFLTMPDGRTIVVAIYVTGQGSKRQREARIATIARGVLDNMAYAQRDNRGWTSAPHRSAP